MAGQCQASRERRETRQNLTDEWGRTLPHQPTKRSRSFKQREEGQTQSFCAWSSTVAVGQLVLIVRAIMVNTRMEASERSATRPGIQKAASKAGLLHSACRSIVSKSMPMGARLARHKIQKSANAFWATMRCCFENTALGHIARRQRGMGPRQIFCSIAYRPKTQLGHEKSISLRLMILQKREKEVWDKGIE